MSWRNKLELGLKENAGSRKDNLPPSEVGGPEIPSGPGRSPEITTTRPHHENTSIPASAVKNGDARPSTGS